MTAAPKICPGLKSLTGILWDAEPLFNGRRPMLPWEEMGKCTREAHRGRGPSTWGKICRDNVGKDHLPAVIGDNLQRRGGIGEPKPPRGIWFGARANMSKEEEVTLLEVVLDATPNRVIPGAGKEALGPGGPSWVHRLWGFDPSMTVPAPRRTSRWVNRDWEGRM